MPPVQLPDHPRFEATRRNLAALESAGLPGAERMATAARWAIACHLGQTDRPDGAPYLQHVTSVAARVVRWHPAPTGELAAAALLHDSVEDQPAKLTELGGGEDALAAVASELGPRVAAMVKALTNPPFDEAVAAAGHVPGTPAFRAVKLLRYAEHFIELLAGDDGEVALIKLADFTDNALSLDGVQAANPGRYARLVRKYRPCVAFLREHLPAAPDGSGLAVAWGELEKRVEAAWVRDFGG